MDVIKEKIISNICYTELVYARINRKLNLDLSNEQIEEFIREILEGTPVSDYSRAGKNYYVCNQNRHVRITINSSTFRIITADRI